MIIYDNFKKLVEERVDLAVELLDKCTPDGWYTGWFDTEKYKPSYFNGAPNPFDFIDLEGLGVALSRNWDESCYYRTNTDEVLSTSYGW